ncbi:MAG: Rne/Rng family ribonuclease [Acidobacteria bacterium]|nr:Rne/Rng family ribonuclease [Acidobacteriota bacterium]
MSKEMVVSSTRHETRVAVLEDDQVVEIYYQRENEYSLAGSIHKGRVTRVLPGMQSAFVDVGLERDAFLYVSDFFEDNEEYEKVVSSVEDKVLRLEKGQLPAQPQEAPKPAAEEPVPPPAAVATAAPAAPAAPAPAASHPPQERQEREERERRGRRSRRRRPKGRGLPESKFYSVRGEAEAPAEHAERAEEPAEVEEEDIVVLPGESLAKYSRSARFAGEPEGAEDDADEFNEGSETPAEAVTESEPGVELEAGETAGPDLAAEEPALEETGEAPASEEETDETPEDAAEEFVAAEIELPEAPDAGSLEEAVAEGSMLLEAHSAEPLVTEEPEEIQPEESAAEPAEPEAGEETAEDIEPEPVSEPLETEAEASGEEDADKEEQPEPARIPTSLTATLREQGPRYLHRVSRRMRRKAREEQQRGGAPNRDFRAHEQKAELRAEQPRPAREARPEKQGAPSISDLLREGQEIIVQVAKEPLGQKGARITSHIALPGRFLVYMPTVDHIGVSRKIASDEERARLKRILQAHRTGIPGGFIVRTAGEGKPEEELRNDMLFLYNLWIDIRQKAEKKPAPMLIHHDLDVVQRTLRDQLTTSFKNIWVDNEELYESIVRFVQRFQPSLVSRVKLYTRPTPIFDQFGITQELEKALRPKVWLKSGGYIVINQTEALVAIDVNTGKYVGKSNRLEDTIVKTNTDAIREIVRQIRLRDLGGIIVVDFIDMDERKNRQKVMQALEEAMRSDRAPYKILSFNDFGLVAITRKRVKQSLERTLCSPCPYCEGAGYVKSVQTVIGEILIEAQKLAKAVEGEDVVLRVNPEVGKVLKSNQNDYLQEIEEILGRNVMVKSDPMLHQEKFDLA